MRLVNFRNMWEEALYYRSRLIVALMAKRTAELECDHDWDDGRCLKCGDDAPEPDDFSGASEGDR